jgi:hypothetical protein
MAMRPRNTQSHLARAPPSSRPSPIPNAFLNVCNVKTHGCGYRFSPGTGVGMASGTRRLPVRIPRVGYPYIPIIPKCYLYPCVRVRV